MNPKKNKADPVRMFRKAHAKIFDQPTGVDLSNQIKAKFAEFIKNGNPAGFRNWLTANYPDWENDNVGQFTMGAAYKYEQNYTEAERHFMRCSQMRRISLAAVLSQLALIAMSRENYGKAWDLYNQALEIAPDSYSVHLNRLCLASVQEDEKKMTKVIDELFELFPDWPEDEEFVRLLKSDGELSFLRGHSLWNKINNKFNK